MRNVSLVRDFGPKFQLLLVHILKNAKITSFAWFYFFPPYLVHSTSLYLMTFGILSAHENLPIAFITITQVFLKVLEVLSFTFPHWDALNWLKSPDLFPCFGRPRPRTDRLIWLKGSASIPDPTNLTNVGQNVNWAENLQLHSLPKSPRNLINYVFEPV